MKTVQITSTRQEVLYELNVTAWTLFLLHELTSS